MNTREIAGRLRAVASHPNLLPGLISYGIPVALAATGVVVLLLWSQTRPDVGTPAARVPGPQSVSSTATAPPVPGQAFSSGNPPGTGVAPPVGGGPGMGTPSGPGMGPGMTGPGGPGGPGMAGPGGLGPPAGPMAGTMGGPGGGPPAAVANLPGSWLRFRGKNLDNLVKEAGNLARSWPVSGPKKLWSVPMGEGYASAAVANSRVYVLDYDQTARADALRCLSLADGKELWRQAYPVEIKRNHGMSRTVPAISGKYVVTIGPKCHVMCCDTMTGKVYWKIDMVRKWGTTVPQWYAGQCPLIDGNRVILAPGGRALMAAVDLATGKVIWETPNPKGWKMTHASIIPATIGGQKLYLWPASMGVVGVTPEGKLVWETMEWRVSTATVPSALPIGDGRVFFCGGYNGGAIMLKVTAQGGTFGTQVLFRLKASVFGSDQQTPILYQGHILGVIPGGQLVCLNLDGKTVWTSGPTRSYGLGPYMMAGNLMYLLDDYGTLTLAEVSPRAFKPLATAKVLAGPEAWGPFALAGGRLICRDMTTMVCLEVGK